MIVNIYHNCQSQDASNWANRPKLQPGNQCDVGCSDVEEITDNDADHHDDESEAESCEAVGTCAENRSSNGCGEMSPSPNYGISPISEALRHAHENLNQLRTAMTRIHFATPSPSRIPENEITLRRQVEQLESKVNRFREVIAEQDGQIDALTEDRDQLQQQLETAESRLAAQNEDIAHLIAQRDHCKRQRDHYRELLNLLLTQRVEVVSVGPQKSE